MDPLFWTALFLPASHVEVQYKHVLLVHGEIFLKTKSWLGEWLAGGALPDMMWMFSVWTWSG
jgi:hypothetical protein